MFRLVNDPGHWGASDPQILVLGISKGNTQSKAFGTQQFDTIAYKGIRPRLLLALQAIGLLVNEDIKDFNDRFTATESDFAFASMVRCSVTGMHRRKGFHTADSPNVVPAFKPGSAGYPFVENCVRQYLLPLGQNTKFVILLGNADNYMEAVADIIEKTRGPIARLNDVAFTSSGVCFVHVAHPSKGNGHFGSFIRGEGVAGRKRDLARIAVSEFRTEITRCS